VPEKIFEFGPRVQKMGLTIEKAEFPYGLAEFVFKKVLVFSNIPRQLCFS
jgi:hypothetical protein